ncbi:MAG: hypothetical protein Dbin4_02545 [Alphaproteobacteria bacterium]|nr:hypothetical protein [Alphaproteobacteria bacterium]
MPHPIEEALMQSVKDNNAVFMAGYEEGYEAGKRDALMVIKGCIDSAAALDEISLPRITGESK